MSRCNGLDMNDVTFPSKEDLSFSMSAIQGRCVGIDFVSEDIIVETVYVECRIGCMETCEEIPIR